MHKYNIPLSWLTLTLMLLSGCGGGGGGTSGSSLVYQGKTDAAQITGQNAGILADNVLAGRQFAGAINALRTEAPQSGDAIGMLPMVLLFRGQLDVVIPRHVVQSRNDMQAARAVNDVLNCTNGGLMRITGDIADNGTGDLVIDMTDCREGAETANGQIHMHIDAFDSLFFLPIDVTMSFSSFRLSAAGFQVSIDGTLDILRIQDSNSERISVNLVALNEDSGEMIKLENLVIKTSFPVGFGETTSVSLSGRVYDSNHGYVDVTTLEPLQYSDQLADNPDQGGQLLLTGAQASKVTLMAASAQKLRLEIDSSGNGQVDQHQVYYWTDIGGTPAPNEAPQISNWVIQPASPYTTDDLRLDLSGISDPDGDPVSYQVTWSRNGDVMNTADDNEFPASLHGKGDVISMEMTLSDGVQTTSKSTFVTILNSPPVVDAGPDQALTFGDLVNLQGSANDADGDALNVSWSVTNLFPLTGVQLSDANALTPRLEYLSPESFSVRLTVSDGEDSQTDEVDIVIDPMPLFQPVQQLASPTGTEAVSIGDMNNDGLNDVVVSTSFSNIPGDAARLFVLLQDASGNLAPAASYDPGLGSVSGQGGSTAIADMNNDGRNDVVISLADGVGVMLQNTQGTLDPVQRYQSSHATYPQSYKIVAADFNNDGLDDVASINWGSQSDDVDVFLQNSSATLDSPTPYIAPHGGWDDLAFGDVNGDGLNDIVVMSGQGFAADNFSVLLQQPGNGFSSAIPYDLGFDVNASAIGVGDVNGDGRDDVVLAYGGNRPSSNIAVYYQNVTGTLDAPLILPSHDIPTAVEIADIDGDSRLDVIVSHSGWPSMSLYLQKADGTLHGEQRYPFIYSSHNPHRMAVGDINADGKNDIVEAAGDGIAILYQ